MNLIDYFYTNTNRPAIHKPVEYFGIYEKHFNRFRGGGVKVLEIGVENGGSLKMWKNYFGKASNIIGIDINPKCREFEEEGIRIYTGDQSDPAFIDAVISIEGVFDIVIDDGSHMVDHQTKSFELIYGNITDDGIYLIEDIGTSYWKEYGGGLGVNRSFIEYSKRRIDELNARSCKEMSPVAFTMSTNGIHFYENIVVFEKQIRKPSLTKVIGVVRV